MNLEIEICGVKIAIKLRIGFKNENNN